MAPRRGARKLLRSSIFTGGSTSLKIKVMLERGLSGPVLPLRIEVSDMAFVVKCKIECALRLLNETQGERACILPGCVPWTTGAFPLLECDSQTGRVTKMDNGGTPQQGNLSLHLQLIRETLPSWIPDEDWSGNAVTRLAAWKHKSTVIVSLVRRW